MISRRKIISKSEDSSSNSSSSSASSSSDNLYKHPDVLDQYLVNKNVEEDPYVGDVDDEDGDDIDHNNIHDDDDNENIWHDFHQLINVCQIENNHIVNF